jgi:hypothetical protein
MRGSGAFGRVLAATLGVLMVLGGLAALGVGGETAPTAVWIVVVGLALIVAAVIERWRYRSETADRAGLPIGPGGGEPIGAPVESRFQRTEEQFIDPTSGRRMRVWLDGVSGERRYRAED